MAHVQIFLSTVSAEFRSYRDALRHDLTRPNVSVAVQEDFIVTGTETLDMLDDYIRQCDAVIHLVGDMTGASAQAPSLALIRQRYPDMGGKLSPLAPFLQPDAPALPYTHWEAWLALYHGKPLIIAVPEENAPRDKRFELIPAQRAAQEGHLQRLAEVERYRGIKFTSPDRLAVEVLRSKLHEILARAGPVDRPANLPFLSRGELFKGREATLDELTCILGPVPDSNTTPVIARVLSGMGGVGKTRLAIEYAWRHVKKYRALLFVGADGAEALQRNLAALCTRSMLDLPEQQEKEEVKQYEAVLRRLRQEAGWLLILDNVDSKPAATAVEALLPHLTGGHVLITSRLADWSVRLAPVKLDVLASEAAADFLLIRTDARRRKEDTDPVTVLALAKELGYLALALEQAGAYIAQRRLSFNQYVVQWQNQRDKVLTWFDKQTMQYHSSVAITWQTSFNQLTAPARQLLQRLAWLAPDPIPETLLEVQVPQSQMQADAFDALAELESHSLVNRADDHPSFSVHRLVQEITRQGQRDEKEHAALTDALRWINSAFTSDPTNPTNWPVLDPLLPHARAVALHAGSAGITEPTAQLMNQAGLLLHQKAQYAEAAPLYQYALAIREKILGPEHPDVAMSLNNLAELYRTQGLYAQAEPLHQRALTIREQVLGPSHPDVGTSLNNLALIYKAQGAYAKAEPLYHRALVICAKTLGPDHPRVAMSLDNLALLYAAQGLYAQAEPFHQRALAIFEQVLGPEHPDVATSLNNLAGLYSAQGLYPQAEPFHQRALTIREQVLGPSHPDVAMSLNNLALLYAAQGLYAQAEPLCQRALALFLRSLGSGHPSTRTVQENYVGLLRAMRKTDEDIAEAIRSLGQIGA